MTRNGTVYVIDDDAEVRASLEILLGEVGLAVHCFATVDEFRASFDPRAISCLVLDVRLPGTCGLVFHREMRDEGIDVPVIVITGHGDVKMAVDALHEGAFDFIEKPFRPQALLDQIQSALAWSRHKKREETERRDLERRWSRLTDREVEVTRELLTGRTNKEVAARMRVTPQAIDGHRGRIFHKLEVRNVAELVRLALRLGVETPPDCPTPGTPPSRADHDDGPG